MKKFEKLLESLETIKQVKILRYPKQIQLSEDFKRSLAKELVRQQALIKESNGSIVNFDEKFLKALKFFLYEKKKEKKQSQLDFKPRQQWDINPRERVHGSGKKDGYNRSREKRNWSREE